MRERPVWSSGLDFRVLPYQALFAPFPHHLYNLLYCLWITFGTGQAVVVAETGRRTAGWIFAPQFTVAGVVMVVVVVVIVMHMVAMVGSGRRQVRNVLDPDVINATARRPVMAGDVLGEIGGTGCRRHCSRADQVWIQDSRGNCCRCTTSHGTAGLRRTVGLLLLPSDYFVLTIRHRFVAMEQPGRGVRANVVLNIHSKK